MTLIRFLRSNGEHLLEVEAEPDANLLDVAQAAGLPLEGTCEGQMACSTCHVIIDTGDFDKLPRASEDEEDMLDLAAGTTRTSRLSCQIQLPADLDTLTVRIPAESRNMQGA